MARYTEHEVSQAIKDIRNGLSLRKASLRWAVPRTTLDRRLKVSGRRLRSQARQLKQPPGANKSLSDVPEASAIRPLPPQETSENHVAWKTPKKAKDVRDQFRRLAQITTIYPSQRLLFKKIIKAFEEQDVQLAALEKERESLEAELASIMQARKRKRLQLSPNSKLITIKDIEDMRRAPEESGRVVGSRIAESEHAESATEDQDCIVVG